MEAASLRYGPAMDPSASASLSRSFERHLRAKNLSDGTVASYLVGVRQFTAFLQPHGRELIQATRADLEAFIGDLLARWSPATASTRYKQLQALYRWLEDEEEIAVNPMARMKPPVVPDKPIPVVPEDALRRLLAACAGKSFEARRDTALVTFLIDTGARRGEIAGLRLADLDFDLDVALVLGKGRRERALPFGRTTAVALDRSLRVRARPKHAALPWLWIGLKGRLTERGLGLSAAIHSSEAPTWPTVTSSDGTRGAGRSDTTTASSGISMGGNQGRLLGPSGCSRRRVVRGGWSRPAELRRVE
jgi:site-specific recombinase XerD